MMSSPSDPDFDNPYASPMADSSNAAPFSGSVDVARSRDVKKFREQIHALGALWIIIGAIAGGAGVAIWLFRPPTPTILWLVFLGSIGTVWLTLGVLACMKQMWAVYIGLGLSYFSLLGNLASFNLWGVGILLIVIVQAHRVIGWAKKMTAAGIPLTAKRSDFL